MNTAHTPAPLYSKGREVWKDCGEDIRNLIATVHLDETAEADARLFAAAPELLAVLVGLTDWARTHTSPVERNSPLALLVQACGVIEKATGAPYPQD